MNKQNELGLYEISQGFPRGYEIQRFVEKRTLKTQNSVSHLMLNTLGHDPQFLEFEVRQKIEKDLIKHISRQNMQSYDTNFGKAFTMEAVILSQDELYALMAWASKRADGEMK